MRSKQIADLTGGGADRFERRRAVRGAALVLGSCFALCTVLVSFPGALRANDMPIGSLRGVGDDEDPGSVVEEGEASFYDESLPEQSDSVIFVVDRSASMSLPVQPFVGLDGEVVQNATRLDYVKTELKRSISALPEHYTFNIVIFDECVERWQGARQQATERNKARAIAWIDEIVPWGWTNTGGATSLALSDKENTVVLVLSDGAPNFLDCAQTYVADFDTHRRVIREANTQHAVIHTFGIGLDPETRGFLETVARENGGTFREIGR